MSSLTVIKEFAVKEIYNCGLTGNPIPTMKELSSLCRIAGLTTPQNKEITKSTIQYIFDTRTTIEAEWSKGRKEYEKQNPDAIATPSNEADEIDLNETKTGTDVTVLQEFFMQVCMQYGENNLGLPTMRELADLANHNKLTTRRGKPITVSTVNNTLSSFDMKRKWMEGKSQADPIQFQNIEKMQENIEELAVYVKRFCEGKGFLSQQKPTLEQICSFINQQGFRTSTRMTAWTSTTLFRQLQIWGIDIYYEWMKGVQKAKDQLGQTNDIRVAIAECAYEWGLNGATLQPNSLQLAEMLYQKNFHSENGKRLQYGYISTMINANAIPVFQKWNEGLDEFQMKQREKREQEEQQEQEEKQRKEEQRKAEKESKPELTEEEKQAQADSMNVELEQMRKSRSLRMSLKNVPLPPPMKPTEATEATPTPTDLTVTDESTLFTDEQKQYFIHRFGQSVELPPIDRPFSLVAVADGFPASNPLDTPSIEGPVTQGDSDAPDPLPNAPDPLPDTSSKNTPDEWKAWANFSSVKPLNPEDD